MLVCRLQSRVTSKEQLARGTQSLTAGFSSDVSSSAFLRIAWAIVFAAADNQQAALSPNAAQNRPGTSGGASSRSKSPTSGTHKSAHLHMAVF